MHTKFHTTNILRLTIENTAWFFLFLPPRRGLFFGGGRTPGFASLHPGLNSFAASRLQNHPVGTRFVRELPVILDADVAELYGVETKRMNEAVRNNPAKFPPEYMFELTEVETSDLRSNFSSAKLSSKSRVSPKAQRNPGARPPNETKPRRGAGIQPWVKRSGTQGPGHQTKPSPDGAQEFSPATCHAVAHERRRKRNPG